MRIAKSLAALTYTTLLISACTITRPTVTKVTDSYFMVAHPLKYKTVDGAYKIEVPIGFLTDLTSIPRELWWWESPIDRTMGPAIIHDYLYWEQSCSKPEADVVLFLAMKEAGVSKAKRWVVYNGVVIGGESAWDKNKVARFDGETRFLSKSYAEQIMASDTSPNATLKTIYAAAGKNGLVYGTVQNVDVKSACVAAMEYYQKH